MTYEDAVSPPTHPTLEIDNVKMTRETLCIAQKALVDQWTPHRGNHAARLQRLIDQLDEMRPRGSDGKHGDRHTPVCGCEDEDVDNRRLF